ncbi:hypothetical protein R6Z07F_020241 [Ovis aries]
MKGRKKTLWQRRYRGSVKARNMTMRVRRPLKGTLRNKIRSYATPSKKVKNTREPNCFLRSCAPLPEVVEPPPRQALIPVKEASGQHFQDPAPAELPKLYPSLL